jgi:hypothetical protein
MSPATTPVVSPTPYRHDAHGSAANVIFPGYVHTEGNAAGRTSIEASIASHTPLRRVGEPSDSAAHRPLVSPEAAFTTILRNMRGAGCVKKEPQPTQDHKPEQ